MFASASLDGAIVLWSSHSLSYTRQFNFVKNYEGPSHTYPSSTQHVFTVDQVWLIDKRAHLNFFPLSESVEKSHWLTSTQDNKVVALKDLADSER